MNTPIVPKAPYHHGDLRRALVAAALEQIESGSGPQLNLRATAERLLAAGVPLARADDATGVANNNIAPLSLPWLPLPHMAVRVDHDARMAEVVGAENARRFRSIYTYPNADMHQPDEKTQLNLFLGEWLGHCLACGHELQPVL